MHYVMLTLIALAADLALALLVAAFIRAGRGDRTEEPAARREPAPIRRNLIRFPVPLRFR
jgi:hypothetical protein